MGGGNNDLTAKPPPKRSGKPAAHSHQPARRAWAYLLLAAGFEIGFAAATNASHGFTRLGYSIAVVAAAAGAIFFLSLALKTLDLGLGYTVWTGIGSVGTVATGVVLFHEELSPLRVISLAAIICGMLGLKLSTLTASDA